MFEVSAQVEGGAIRPTAPITRSPRQSSRKGGKARQGSKPSSSTPSQNLHGARTRSETTIPSPHATEHPQAMKIPNPMFSSPADTELPDQKIADAQALSSRQPDTDEGHTSADAHQSCALVGEPLAHQGQIRSDDRSSSALVGEITAVYRRYEDLRRARQRVELQAMATCRTLCGGDKVAGMKLYKRPTVEVAAWLEPYDQMIAVADLRIKEYEKLLTKLGKQLPVAAWADTVPGLSHRFLAAIVGECGIGPGEFKSVSALWKRMGMAVINGGRQRRVTGDAAIEHGYVARRRALMWNIGDQVAVRQGVRNPKDEEGKPTGAVAINEWGALYLERKAYELAREVEPGKPMTPMHAHNRAKRYVEKRLLRSLWQEWRRASPHTHSGKSTPAA